MRSNKVVAEFEVMGNIVDVTGLNDVIVAGDWVEAKFSGKLVLKISSGTGCTLVANKGIPNDDDSDVIG
jgi:hypothetical protein